MLFSVIVPIYNVEKYLRRCIDSVLEQTYADYELILVDDGSPDSCPVICDEYAVKDKRIKVIHKPNGGLVSARQAGMSVALGEYVFHLDGDDAILPNALESAYKIISEKNSDIVSFSHTIYNVDGGLGETRDEPVSEGFYDKEGMSRHIYPKLLSDKNMEHVFYFLWGKAIRRELAEKHQMKVNPAISLGEDLSCIVPCYLEAESVYISRTVAYLYTARNDSLSTDFKTQQITHIAEAILGLKRLDTKNVEDFEAQIARYSCFMCFAIIAAAAEGKHFKSLKKIKELIKNSVHSSEIKKAEFVNITAKSRIAIFLMKKQNFTLAFYFLYLCGEIKRLGKGEKA